MSGWYNRIMGVPVQPQAPQMSGMQFANPIQKAQFIMQALTNPSEFVKQQFPDIPDEIATDPNRILQYLQQTRGISSQQIQQLVSQYPMR